MPNTMTRYTGGSTSLTEYSGNFTQALAVTNLHEQGRALLASTFLENVGALSAMEGYLCQVAPSGAHRYKAVADAYTAAICQTLLEW